ncbi:MAG: hypothetical protein Q8T03_13875 [Bacteroidota bacterium]|nr:hypothetical protein [Bacteroidota bacterium]
MKERLLKNWTLWRIIRFVLAITFIVIGIIKIDYILILAGAFLMFQALANTCVSCVGGNCEIPQK